MPRSNRQTSAETFNFRVDSGLKKAFTHATQAENRPAADVLRDFMRDYVKRKEQRRFEAEARRQSRLLAEAADDPSSDEAQVLRELEAAFDSMADDDRT